MPLNKSKVQKILVFTLSNIGDVVLTFPVIDILKRDFPEAELHCMVSPKAAGLLEGNPNIEKIVIYDKHDKEQSKFKWMMDLRREKYDLVVDLKNSALPLFLGPRYRTSFVVKKNEDEHMREKHLRHLRSIYPYETESVEKFCVTKNSFKKTPDTYCLMAPGSANEHKRWSKEGFAKAADYLFEKYQIQTVFVGDNNDCIITEEILNLMKHPAVNFCGQTSLSQTTAVVDQCLFALVNDSAVMHLASYLNKPVLSLFGSVSFPKKYGPWSAQSLFLYKENITDISSEDVLKRIQIKDTHVTFL